AIAESAAATVRPNSHDKRMYHQDNTPKCGACWHSIRREGRSRCDWDLRSYPSRIQFEANLTHCAFPSMLVRAACEEHRIAIEGLEGFVLEANSCTVRIVLIPLLVRERRLPVPTATCCSASSPFR